MNTMFKNAVIQSNIKMKYGKRQNSAVCIFHILGHTFAVNFTKFPDISATAIKFPDISRLFHTSDHLESTHGRNDLCVADGRPRSRVVSEYQRRNVTKATEQFVSCGTRWRSRRIFTNNHKSTLIY